MVEGAGAPVVVRPEAPEDHEAVSEVVAAAFGSTAESELVDRIRASPEYVPEMALVAEVEGVIIGHVMISLCIIRNDAGDQQVSMLSPLAVLDIADERGEPMVILEGSPAYYGRFGFEPSVRYGIVLPLPEWAPSEAGQVRRLSSFDRADTTLRGTVVYPEAFDGLD